MGTGPCGVNIDALRLEVADGGVTPRVLRNRPPAVLLPARVGEPLRGDLGLNPHPRGSGDPWPPEAWLPKETGVERPGRYPRRLRME